MASSKYKAMASSKYKGVRRVANRWRAEIRASGERIFIGSFGLEIDAAIAYNYHAAHFHGDFAKLNRIPDGEYPHD